MDYTSKDIIESLAHKHSWARSTPISASPAPKYISKESNNSCKIAFAVENMRQHMSQEGWEVMLSLQANGWLLAGKNCPINCTDIKAVVEEYKPSTVLMQDCREWSPDSGCCKDPTYAFTNSKYLST